jgi:hypothetical protein
MVSGSTKALRIAENAPATKANMATKAQMTMAVLILKSDTDLE